VTLDLAAVRARITTSLEDEPLQAVIDGAYEALDDYLGVDADEYDGSGTVAELITPRGYGDLLMLSRRALSISAIIEGTTELQADDYELRPSGNMLVRLSTGTNPSSRWSSRVDVTYATVLDGNERDRVALALMAHDINYKHGVGSETIGAWSESRSAGGGEGTTYSQERADILRSYGTGTVVMI
jgi:hypothetical protein